MKYFRILLITFLVLLIIEAGCSYFKVTTSAYPSATAVSTVLSPDRKIVFHDKGNVFTGSQLFVQNDSIYGLYSEAYTPYIKPGKKPVEIIPEPNGSAYRYKRDSIGRGVAREIHIFSDNIKRVKEGEQVRISLSLKDVYRFDVYSKDGSTTTLSWIAVIVLSLPLIMGAIFAIILVIGLITGSCPFIYVNTGDGFKFEGEIYSGAVYAPLERHDYLALPHLVAENGEYLLKMSNEVKEIQYTNLAELLVADHPAGVTLLVDKYGNYQTSLKPVQPAAAVNFNGTDMLKAISSKDSLVYSGEILGDSIPLTDGVIMTFSKPSAAGSAKLFMNVRNTQWLDHVYKSSHELLGSYYDNWVKKQNKADPARLREWPLSQKIPLSVYIEKDGEWVFCDYLNMAGPMAFRSDVLALDIHEIKGDSLRVKLEAGAFFWEIDYAAVDYSLNLPVKISTVKPARAITNREESVADFLSNDDMKYYVQSVNTDVADLAYRVPAMADEARTVILHSKGYYQMLSDARGLPEFGKLREIREPGQFLEYSRELMIELVSGNNLAKKTNEQ